MTPTGDPAPASLLETAYLAHRAGRLEEAERIYRDVLEREPGHAEALHHLGLVRHQQGRTPEGLELLRRAIAIVPAEPRYRFNLFSLLQDSGQAAEAEAARREAAQALEWSAGDALDEASALAEQGNWTEAAHAASIALALEPESTEALLLLGKAALQRKRYRDAHARLSAFTARRPAHAQAWALMGQAEIRLGSMNEAERSLRRALEADPDLWEAHKGLGEVLQAQGQHRASAESFRRALALRPAGLEIRFGLANALAASGRFAEAEPHYREAIQQHPKDARLHSNLSNALRQLGRLDEAVASARRALEIDPKLAEAYGNLGNIAYQRNSFAEAERWLEEALRLNPNLADAQNNLGNTFLRTFRVEEAWERFRAAMALNPTHHTYHSNLLFALNVREPPSLEWMFEQHRRFGEALESRFAAPKAYENESDPERLLRVGFVAADLRRHPVSIYIEALLTHHDRENFHFTVYSSEDSPDRVTERLRAQVEVWREVSGVPDSALAAQIPSDRIDILVDLSGHTGNNRLPLFARKPAPVQATYMAYLNTTGLSRIDYWITDALENPPETQAYFSEKLWYLPRCFVCYTPADFAPEPAPTPLLARGVPAFGCFNNGSKLSPRCVRLWSSVLNAVPGSRLVFKGLQFGDGSVQNRIAGWFQDQGIDPARLEFMPPSPHGAYLASFAAIDVALDPFPFGGNTSTSDALWMGVPVVTLAGDNALSRSGVSLMNAVGHPEWIAHSEEEYVRIAAGLVRDPRRLARLRGSLRGEMARSPLCDGPGFARAMEAAFREMWRRWCEPAARGGSA